MSMAELQTIAHYRLPIKIFVFNNGCYGIIKAYQDTHLAGRYVGSGPDGYSVPADFHVIAQDYGLAGLWLRTLAEVAHDLPAILATDGPVLCDVLMADPCAYEPRIFGWQTPIEDQAPYLDRAEFRANMLIEPWAGWETPAQLGGAHGQA
jgi:acetolactate synthase I/II/III large subunit